MYGFASLRLIPLISRLVFSINASSIAHVSFSKLKTDLKIKRNHKFELGSIKKKVDNLNKVQFKKINFFYDKKKNIIQKV